MKPGAIPAPGEKVRIGNYELSGDDVAMILQEKTARDLRATQIPATAEDYQPALPDTLKLPEGIEWKADPTEPEPMIYGSSRKGSAGVSRISPTCSQFT